MTMTEWLIFFLIVQVVHFLGTWKLYVKAERKAWEAIVPIYNAVVLMKIINRPWWWTFLLFIPIVNLIMFPVLWVETLRSFGKNTLTDTFLGVITLGFYIFYVNYTLDVSHIKDRSLKPKTGSGEWVSSILFAVVAATMVHTYFMQPYVIPTPSLENTLLVGDFLFVSKFHYGARTPMTTVAAPMVHDAIPLTGGVKSYVSKPQLPYFRIPGFQKIKRNDIVVFSWPADTLIVIDDPTKGIRYKPIDKRSNYVKRCVGLPGDTLSIIDGYVHINGERNDLPDRAKLLFNHVVTTNSSISGGLIDRLGGEKNYRGKVLKVSQEILKKDGIDKLIENATSFELVKQDSLNAYFIGGVFDDRLINVLQLKQVSNMFVFNMTPEDAENFKGKFGITDIKKFSSKRKTDQLFPHSANFLGNSDNYGPVYIPRKGATTAINVTNLPYYRRLITEYEQNTLEVKGNQIKINGALANTYTFKQDYYWMMGDNRHNSQDARMWGFVPYDHVVGKPVFIWMSWDTNGKGIMNKIRWNRLFTTVKGNGEPISFFRYFIIALAGWFVFSYFRKKRKTT